jgi:hypothetical protein
MICRLAAVVLIFALATPVVAADNAASADVERMTPAELRKLQTELDRKSSVTREENAALNLRIQELEQANAALGKKKAELETKLADVLARLTALETARKN